jgi:hypothetical protein
MKKNDEARARRRIDDLARSEQNIHERLVGLRSEFDLISKLLDRLTLTRHPRITAGGLTAGGGHGLSNLIPFKKHL